MRMTTSVVVSTALLLVLSATACDRDEPLAPQPEQGRPALPPLLSLTVASSGRLVTTEIQVTASPGTESAPVLGTDFTSSVVAFSRPDGGGHGQVYYHRLSRSALSGLPVLVSEGATHDRLNDLSGDYILYTSYLGPPGSESGDIGEITLYEIASGQTTVISQLTQIFEARVHGRMVAWVEGAGGGTRVMLLNLDGLARGERPIQIAGPSPSAQDIAIGDRLLVWTEARGGQLDVVAYDLATGAKQDVAADPGVFEAAPATSGYWVTWRGGGGAGARIHAYNVATSERRVFGGGTINRNPSIDGDFIAFESNVAGNFDVYVYRLSTSETFQVTSHPADQRLPDVFANQVAYVDRRDGNDDVFVSSFAFEPAVAPLPPAARIAFTSRRDGNDEVYVVNADGSDVGTRLTNNLGQDGFLTRSPDGLRVAFMSCPDSNCDIYVANVDGSGAPTRLTDHPALDLNAQWSPDGERIAFLRWNPGVDDTEIYVMSADGSNEIALTDNTVSDDNPSWSPDGRQIAFKRGDGDSEIYVISADGSTPATPVTDDPAGAFSPRWSPDGQLIAFTSSRDGTFQLFVMSSDGSGERRLTTNFGGTFAREWSPDGRHILVENRSDNDIYLINSDGSGQTKLTDHPAFDGNPVWSPDGLQIAFTSDRDGNSEIYVMNADGSDQTNITHNPAGDFAPAWAPQFKALAPLTIAAPASVMESTTPGRCDATISHLGTPTVSGGAATVTRQPSSDVFPLGTTTVTWTATPAVGDPVSATQQVVVEDRERPVLAVPADRTANTDPGQATATLDPGMATVTDNCPGAGLAGQRADGRPLSHPYPVGVTEITWLALDPAGNGVEARQTIAVVDAEPPVLTGAANITLDATSPAGAAVEYTVTAQDNVDGSLVAACAPQSGSTFPIGVSIVQCGATDGAGNIGRATFEVTVLGAAEQIAEAERVLEAIAAGGSSTPAGDKAEDVLPQVEIAREKLAGTPPDRQGALGELEGAAGDLEAAVKDGVLPAVQGNALLDQIAGAARLLAEQAIAEARARGGDVTKLAEAEGALAQGDSRRAAGQFKDAVAAYKDAVAKAEGA